MRNYGIWCNYCYYRMLRKKFLPYMNYLAPSTVAGKLGAGCGEKEGTHRCDLTSGLDPIVWHHEVTMSPWSPPSLLLLHFTIQEVETRDTDCVVQAPTAVYWIWVWSLRTPGHTPRCWTCGGACLPHSTAIATKAACVHGVACPQWPHSLDTSGQDFSWVLPVGPNVISGPGPWAQDAPTSCGFWELRIRSPTTGASSSGVVWGWSSRWSFFHTGHSCKAPPPCGSSSGGWARTSWQRPCCSGCTCRASCWCGWSGVPAGTNASGRWALLPLGFSLLCMHLCCNSSSSQRPHPLSEL